MQTKATLSIILIIIYAYNGRFNFINCLYFFPVELDAHPNNASENLSHL